MFCKISIVDITFWTDFIFPGISALSALISLITIYILVRERLEKNRPYLQVSFELVRSSLACVVFRNTGGVPLTIKSITFSNDFLSQLAKSKQGLIENMMNSHINIYPGRCWVMSLDVNVFNIINDFETKSVKIDYVYTKINKRKKYPEDETIFFDEYKGFLVYLSEIDEFRQSNEKLQGKIIKAIEENTIVVTSLQDSFVQRRPKGK